MEHFNNDNVDAGDIGAGKHITLLFELTLNGQKASIDKLRYAPDNKLAKSDKTKELAWLKIRWKYPQGITQHADHSSHKIKKRIKFQIIGCIKNYCFIPASGNQINQMFSYGKT